MFVCTCRRNVSTGDVIYELSSLTAVSSLPAVRSCLDSMVWFCANLSILYFADTFHNEGPPSIVESCEHSVATVASVCGRSMGADLCFGHNCTTSFFQCMPVTMQSQGPVYRREDVSVKTALPFWLR